MKTFRFSEISEQIRNGNSAAFEFFYRCEYRNLVHFILNYTHNRVVSEDLAQETLCTIWEKRYGLESGKDLRALTYTIARNKTLNYLKENSFFSPKAEREALTEEILCLQDSSMDQIIDSLQMEDLIRKTFDSMPDDIRETFIMSREEGLTNKEIAEAKNLSIKTIEYRISKALRIFRKNWSLSIRDRVTFVVLSYSREKKLYAERKIHKEKQRSV